jgi:hypothetical protein
LVAFGLRRAGRGTAIRTVSDWTEGFTLPSPCFAEKRGKEIMKIAIPLASGKLCAHFGHCEQMALLEVDENRHGCDH